MYIFKYHPDNNIYRNGVYTNGYAGFISDNPGFPLMEGSFCEYRGDSFDLINNEGHHLPQDIADYQELIDAIGGLNV